MTVNLLLWALGVALIAAGALYAREPYRRYQALQATDQNVRRYEDWRGSRRTEGERGVTGADVMREVLRGQVRNRLAIAVVGFVLVFLGFAVR